MQRKLCVKQLCVSAALREFFIALQDGLELTQTT